MNRTAGIGNARIALVGRPGNGTSLVAEQLAGALGVEQISFEREICKVAEQVSGRKIDRRCPADRKMLIDIGTRWGCSGEAIDADLEARLSGFWPYAHGEPDIWARAVDRTIAEIPPNTPLVLDAQGSIDELLFFLDRGFCVFRVLCSVEAYRRRLMQEEDFHAIDSGLDSGLYSWISDIFAKIVACPGDLPVLWNDAPFERGKIREIEPPGSFVTLQELIMDLQNNVRDGMLCPEENAKIWRLVIDNDEFAINDDEHVIDEYAIDDDEINQEIIQDIDH